MTTRPIIGIHQKKSLLVDSTLPAHTVGDRYIESVLAAGGIPLPIPVLERDEKALERLASLCDAFIFAGGEDVAPDLYGQEPSADLGSVCRERDLSELALFRIIDRKKPVLGICRGIQLINVALGGTLVQHLGAPGVRGCEHGRQNEKRCRLVHAVRFEKESVLAGMFGETCQVNSLHHQAVDRLGQELRVSAYSATDGIVEAIEGTSPGAWLVAVQWHPEDLWQAAPKGAGLQDHLKIFKALVMAC